MIPFTMQECKKCSDLTAYVQSISSMKGNVICEDCIEALGIVPVNLPYDPKTGYSEIGTEGGFRWLKSDGTIGHLKDGETMDLNDFQGILSPEFECKLFEKQINILSENGNIK